MKRPNRTFFFSFLSSSLILVLINLITLIAVYLITNKEQFQLEMNSVSLQLEKTLNIMDSRFEEIGNMALRLSKDREIIETIRIEPPLENKHYGTLYQLSARFQHYNQQTTFIDQVLIIFKKSGIVITDFGSSPDIEKYAKNFFLYEKEKNYTKWAEKINIWEEEAAFFPADTITTMKNKVHAITFKYPITVGMSSPGAVFIALIPLERIDYYFEELLARGCSLYINDLKGNRLYQKENKDTSSSSTILKANNDFIQIELCVPKSYINDRLFSNKIAIIAILAVNLLLLTVIAIFLARKDSQPLNELMIKLHSYVPGQSKPKQESYQWINQSLEKIVGDKFNTETTVALQWARLRIGFYEQLIRGSFADEDEIYAYLESINLPLPEGPHYVAIMTVVPLKGPNQPDPTAQKLILHSYTGTHSFSEWHHHQNGLGEVIVIPANRSYEDFLYKNQQELYKSTGVITLLCMGRSRETLFELKDSFEEARKILLTSQTKTDAPLVKKYTTYKSLNNAYHYDKKDKERLVNAVHSGNLNNVIESLDQIFRDNYEYEKIPTSGLIRLFADITTTVNEIVRNKGMGIEGIPPNYNRYLELYTSQEDFYNRIITLLEPITNYLQGDKKSHNTQLIRNIKEYIGQYFTDPMLCQGSVAQFFKLNPQYISRFFKEQTGESFSRYLENLRMEKAIELIKNKDSSLTLKEIATRSGYLSWNSFYKAFKRFYGTTPGEFKKHRQIS